MEARRIKVLLIEDDPATSRVIGRMLATFGRGSFDMECVDRLSKGIQRLNEEGEDGFDAVLLDPGDSTIIFHQYEEERLRVADFRTAIPHFHVSPTEIVLLSYYYLPGACGCWVVPAGPFFVNGDGSGSGACGGEQSQFPDGNTNLGCCSDHGLNFSLE